MSISVPAAILHYIERGWRVFPVHGRLNDGNCTCHKMDCGQIAKHPRTANGLKDASSDLHVVERWLKAWPTTNWAIRTGAESGLVVLDVDPKNSGDESLADLVVQHGKLPNTIEAITGSGGRHIYFAHPGFDVPNSASKVGPGLDVRGDGGYVVAPPSTHAIGKQYRWEDSSLPSETTLYAMPGWLLSLVTMAPAVHLNGHAPAQPIPTEVTKGGRNAILTSLGGSLRKRGATPEAIDGALQAINLAQCSPPLGQNEVSKIAKSVGRYEPDVAIGVSTTGDSEPYLRREGDAYFWLWPSVSIGIGFDLMRETYSGLTGEVSVQTIAATADGGADQRGHIHQARFNLSDTESRRKLGAVLSQRRGGPDWDGMLETACYRTVDAWREGEPVVNLAHLPFDTDERFAISRLLPLGETTVFYADGGTGKSYLALALGMAIQTGVSLPNGIRPEIAGNVLVLDWETNGREHAKRIAWLAKGFGISPPDLYYRAMRRSIADDAAVIRKFISRYAVDLVIVDSLGSACGGEPENAETMLRAFDALRSFDPATRLVITHISHAGAEQTSGAAHAFGSRYVHNMARSLWELRRGADADDHIDVGFYHRKVNSGPLHKPFGLRLRFENAQRAVRIESLDVLDDPELGAHASIGQRIRAALRQGQKSVKDMSEQLDIPENRLRATIHRLPDVQLIQEGVGRGKSSTYGLVARGDESDSF